MVGELKPANVLSPAVRRQSNLLSKLISSIAHLYLVFGMLIGYSWQPRSVAD